jgi:hypothetical protein
VAIQATIAASLPLDKGNKPAKRRRFRRACAGLDRRDSVLAAYRRFCFQEANLYDAFAAPCFSRATCVPKFVRVYRTTDAYLAAYRHLDMEIARLVSDPRCRTALRSTAAELAAYRRSNGAVGRLITAFRSGSSHQVKTAARNLNRVAASNRKVVRTNHKQLSDFRAGCR